MTESSTRQALDTGLVGPKCWLLSAIAGALAGLALTLVVGGGSDVSPLLILPFGILLASIAIMPFVDSHFWHDHFPDFAFFLGSLVAAFYLKSMTHGGHAMLHAMIEYYSFIALVGGLYVVSGGILIDLRGQGKPWSNTLLLAVGSVLANIVGTTGASVLLIRPFLRMNRGRLHPIHVVMFIFIVSNCAGSLTPVGDPPLYLGYLKGVPFFWVAEHMWYNWVLVIGLLLGLFFAIDWAIKRRVWPFHNIVHSDPPTVELHREHGGPLLTIRGAISILCLGLMIFGVFVDPLLKSAFGIEGIPVGATFQIGVAVFAHRMTKPEIHKANEFSFFPVKEVGLLFLGIFATMVPALQYLESHGAKFDIKTPTQFYFLTGALSSVLDNAPTYLNFLQVAFGEQEITPQAVREFIGTHRGEKILDGISNGAVFFGAMTYIGNGPNFMVKAIAESAGVKMPSFFGYVWRALLILLPVIVLNWWCFIR